CLDGWLCRLLLCQADTPLVVPGVLDLHDDAADDHELTPVPVPAANGLDVPAQVGCRHLRSVFRSVRVAGSEGSMQPHRQEDHRGYAQDGDTPETHVVPLHNSPSSTFQADEEVTQGDGRSARLAGEFHPPPEQETPR